MNLSSSDDYPHERFATIRDLGHDCPSPWNAVGKHRACPVCDCCDYGNSISTTTGTCETCWAEIAAARKARYPDYCKKNHSCKSCDLRFCVEEREVGASYTPGLTKEAKAHLRKLHKNLCAYCLTALLESKDFSSYHTGITRALEVYKKDHPDFDPNVRPEPHS